MSKRLILAVDAMGGDRGVAVTVPAAFRVVAAQPEVELILVGDAAILQPAVALRSGQIGADRIRVQHASEVVLMDELPSRALRNKKDSSMRVALNLVKNGEAHACVSAGNTGALVATARFVLKTLPGIDRPAINTYFPTMIPNKVTNILDLGANVDLGADYLFQLAVMGSVLSAEVDNVDRPKVALLNIGSEEIKGNDTIKKAAQLLIESPHINYVGFVEGDDLFRGNVDVIVCDGFTGNVVLKTIEGALKLVKFYAKRSIMRNLITRIMAIMALPILRSLQREIDPGRYNGATLIGLPKVVIKSHGGANEIAFAHALEKAIVEAQRQVPEKIGATLAEILQH